MILPGEFLIKVEITKPCIFKMLMHIFIDSRVAIDEQVQGGVGTGSKEDVGGHSHHVI